MKKKVFALVLALVLCLGLAAPAGAVDASEMDAATKQAYYTVLTSQINQHGIPESYGGSTLEDMNNNRTPELIVICYSSEGNAYIYVWTIDAFRADQESERRATQAAFEQA